MKNISQACITIIIFMSLGYLIGFLHCHSYKINYVPSPCELQQLLNEIEPENPLVIDCISGPLMREKWNRVHANQWAAEMHLRFMGE